MSHKSLSEMLQTFFRSCDKQEAAIRNCLIAVLRMAEAIVQQSSEQEEHVYRALQVISSVLKALAEYKKIFFRKKLFIVKYAERRIQILPPVAHPSYNDDILESKNLEQTISRLMEELSFLPRDTKQELWESLHVLTQQIPAKIYFKVQAPPYTSTPWLAKPLQMAGFPIEPKDVD